GKREQRAWLKPAPCWRQSDLPATGEGHMRKCEVTMAEWLSRLKRLFSFLKFGYEPEANTVVVTLRLNAYFVQGAVAAAVLLTLVFKYGGISIGSALQLVLDLSRIGVWFWGV